MEVGSGLAGPRSDQVVCSSTTYLLPMVRTFASSSARYRRHCSVPELVGRHGVKCLRSSFRAGRASCRRAGAVWYVEPIRTSFSLNGNHDRAGSVAVNDVSGPDPGHAAPGKRSRVGSSAQRSNWSPSGSSSKAGQMPGHCRSRVPSRPRLARTSSRLRSLFHDDSAAVRRITNRIR